MNLSLDLKLLSIFMLFLCHFSETVFEPSDVFDDT